MRETEDIAARAAHLDLLMQERFGARKSGLTQKVAQVGRDLPRGPRRDLLAVAEAAHLSTHPKLALRIDQARIAAASKRAESYLRGVDAKDRRTGRRLGMLAGLAVNLGLAAALLIALLRWRGFV